MRIAIVGAGAIGGVIAGLLLESRRHDVRLLARGAHLDAIRSRGLVVEAAGRRLESKPVASDRPADLGVQDLLIVTAKAHSVASLAPALGPMMSASTVVLAVQNGVPWWYLHGLRPGEDGEPLPVVDPGGVAWKSIGPHRVLGGVVNMPARVERPGVVLHEGSAARLAVGAPRAGDHAEAIPAIVRELRAAGIDATAVDDIRLAVWRKLLVNLSVGPVSVLFGTAVGPILASRSLADLRTRAVREALAVATAWGTPLEPDWKGLIEGPLGPADHKPSMLQDFEARRPLELDAIVTAVIDLARRRAVPVPTLEALLELARARVEMQREVRTT